MVDCLPCLSKYSIRHSLADAIYAEENYRLTFGIGQASNTDKLEVWINDSNNYASDSVVNYGQWNHVVLTWDGSDLKFYQDGGPDGSSAATAYTNPGVKQIGHIGGGDKHR